MSIFKIKPFVTIFLLCFSIANACKYTVREIGYSSLSATTYILYYVSTSDKPLVNIKEYYKQANVKVKAFLYQNNLKNELINYIHQNKISLPAYILASDKRGFIALSKTQVLSVLQSPLALFLQQELSSRYGVVLLLEGENSAQNKISAQIFESICNKLANLLPNMPKVVHKPPIIKIISKKDFEKEKILLWSAGIKQMPKSPKALVLYGKGRMMGEVLHFEDFEKKGYTLLSIIGADCECGLDRKWMLGPQILLDWGEHISTFLNKDLGFDVEHPMVLTEMSRILAMENKNPKAPDGITYAPVSIDLDDRIEDTIDLEATTDTVHVILYSLSAFVVGLMIIFLIIIRKIRQKNFTRQFGKDG